MLYLLILCYKVEPWLAHSRHCSTHSVRTERTPAERLAITLQFLATGNSQVRSFVFVDTKTLNLAPIMHLSMWSLTRDVQERQEKHQGIYVNFHRNNHPKGGAFSIHNNNKHNPPFIDPLSFGDCQEIWRSCLPQWVRQQILKIYNPLFCPYVPWWGLTLIGALIVYVVTLGHRCRNRGGEATAPPNFLACPYLTMEKLHKIQHQSRFYSIPVPSSEVFKG